MKRILLLREPRPFHPPTRLRTPRLSGGILPRGPAPSPSHLLGSRTQSVSSACAELGPSSGAGSSSSSNSSRERSRRQRGPGRGASSGNGSMVQPDPTPADPAALPPAARAGQLPAAASGTAHVPRRNQGNREPPAPTRGCLRPPRPAPRAQEGPRTTQPMGFPGLALQRMGGRSFFQS